MKRITLINCVVIDHITGAVEVAPFIEVEGDEVARDVNEHDGDDTKTGIMGSANFSQLVMDTEKNVHQVFFGKKCETIFDEENQKMVLRNVTDGIDIITINIDVRKFEISK